LRAVPRQRRVSLTRGRPDALSARQTTPRRRLPAVTALQIPKGMPSYDDLPKLDVAKVRADFPILDREINGRPLVYLDSANTSQKPQQVIEAVREHLARHNANVARSVHTLGTEATAAYEGARGKVARFIGATN